MTSPDQFRNALIDFTEAVSALAIYTHALKKVAATHRSVENQRHISDGPSPVDILEQIAKQLVRATNGLRCLYACRSAATQREAVLWAEDIKHEVRAGSRQHKQQSSSAAAPRTHPA